MADIVVIDTKTATVVTATPAQTAIIVDDKKANPTFTEADPDIYVVEKAGPRGLRGEQGETGGPGPEGPAGPQGVPGLTGPGSFFPFVQMTPLMEWEVEHNLNKAYPEVKVILSDGTPVEGEVGFLDATHLTISFSAAVSGEAYLT